MLKHAIPPIRLVAVQSQQQKNDETTSLIN